MLQCHVMPWNCACLLHAVCAGVAHSVKMFTITATAVMVLCFVLNWLEPRKVYTPHAQ